MAATIILVTRNQATYLNLALASLERQRFPKHVWEVIVVDNTSQDTTAQVTDHYAKSGHLHLIRIKIDQRSRRTPLLKDAVALARGRILIFINADRLVRPDFLLQHLLLQFQQESIVIGDDHHCIHTHLFAPDEPAQEGIVPAPLLTVQDLDDPQKMSALTFPGDNDYGPLFAYFEEQRQPAPYPWVCFTAANASVPKEAIERVGGLDEYFSGWGLEDIDLAYRLHKAGLPFRFAPKAVTLRQLRPSKDGQQRDLTRDLNHFFCKHPDMNTIEREILLRGKYTATE